MCAVLLKKTQARVMWLLFYALFYFSVGPQFLWFLADFSSLLQSPIKVQIRFIDVFTKNYN